MWEGFFMLMVAKEVLKTWKCKLRFLTHVSCFRTENWLYTIRYLDNWKWHPKFYWREMLNIFEYRNIFCKLILLSTLPAHRTDLRSVITSLNQLNKAKEWNHFYWQYYTHPIIIPFNLLHNFDFSFHFPDITC